MDIKVSTMEAEVLKAYLPDYSAELHVRRISRLVKRNHRTVSIALKSLEKKGVVRHEAAGRNKQYRLNFQNFITKEYVKNAEFLRTAIFIEKHFLLKRMMDRLSDDIKDNTLVVFGSYAKGEESKESDIDMLVLRKGGKDNLAKGIRGFLSMHDREAHIHQVARKGFEAGLRGKDNLIMEIVKSHVILNNIGAFVDILWRHYAK